MLIKISYFDIEILVICVIVKMEEHSQMKKTKLKKYPNIKSIDLSRSKLEHQKLKELHSQRQAIKKMTDKYERLSHNMPQLLSKQNEHPSVDITCQLPKIEKMASSRFADDKQNWMRDSIVYNNKSSQFKQFGLNRTANYVQNLKYSPKNSSRQEQMQNFIDRISIIREKGSQLEKSTNGVINKAKHANFVMSKKYGKLRQNSNTILTGIQDYCLEQERNKKYKKDIREMWMKYDK